MTVTDGYDVSLEAAQCEAAISKKECAELEKKIAEMEKKMLVLHVHNEQQADKLETLQCKGIYETIKLTVIYCCDIVYKCTY